MDIWFNLLLFLHLVALAVGTATNIALPLVMGLMPQLAADKHGAVMAIGKRLSTNSRGALVVLVITGLAMLWLRHGGIGELGAWFWVKMVLVVALAALIVASAVVPKEKLNPKIFGMATRLVLLGIIFSAVMAFN